MKRKDILFNGDALVASVEAIREKLNVSQGVFAYLLNVSKVTAISWEKGRRKPSGAALRPLDLVQRRPEILKDVES